MMNRWISGLSFVIVICVATACSVSHSDEKVTGKAQINVLEDGSVGSAELVFVSDASKRDKLEEAVAKMRRWKFKPSGKKATHVLPIIYTNDGSGRSQ